MTKLLSVEEAKAWQRSWDDQQQGFMADREERFAYLVDMIASLSRDRPLRVLDLAGGPGSLTARVLAACVDATVTAVDLDPVLLSIYRSAYPGAAVAEVDLRDPSWTAALAAGEPFDAVMTATAMHWLDADSLRRLYRDLAGLIRPGGLFLNADHHPLAQAGLAAHCQAVAEVELSRLVGDRLDWAGWWESVAGDPALGVLLEEPTRRFADRGEEFAPGEPWHVEALRSAGFREAAVVWRRGRDAIVAGLR